MNDTASVDEVPVVNSRGNLHASVAIRQRHERELSAAEAAVERAQAVIDAADDADHAATEAEKQAAVAARDWALRGAFDADGDETEVSAAVESRQIAQRLALKAAGARAALPTLHEAESAAGRALDSARFDVRQAITGIILDQSKDLFVELVQLQKRYTGLMAQAQALAVLLSPRWASGHPFRDALSSDLNVGARVQALRIDLPADDHPLVREHIARLNGFARALLADPNVELDQ